MFPLLQVSHDCLKLGLQRMSKGSITTVYISGLFCLFPWLFLWFHLHASIHAFTSHLLHSSINIWSGLTFFFFFFKILTKRDRSWEKKRGHKLIQQPQKLQPDLMPTPQRCGGRSCNARRTQTVEDELAQDWGLGAGIYIYTGTGDTIGYRCSTLGEGQ